MANDFLNFVTFFVSCSQTRMNVVYIREEPAVNPSLRKIKKFTQVKLNYISRNHNKPVRWMNFDEAFPRSPIYRNLWIAVPPKCSWFGWGGVRTFAPPRRTATRSSLLTQHVLQVFPSFVQIKEQRDPIHKNIILLSHKYKNRRVNDGRIWMKCHISKWSYRRDKAIGLVGLHTHEIRRRGKTNVRPNMGGYRPTGDTVIY